VSTPVFVVNCGSSSLKYRLVDGASGTALASGAVERIGEPGAPAADHEAALRAALRSVGEVVPVAVAHRVVHGGERFTEPVVIDDEVLAVIRDLASLAPLHNPVNALGIEVARRVMPDVPHVAVFDTAFHHTLPARAYTYAVPPEWGVRRYGFHGTSHAFVARAAARLLGRSPGEVNLIVLHLGNGASAAAVEGGRSVDTSMGLTPLEGLVMGTRSGDLDPAILLHLLRQGVAPEAIDDALNHLSGMVALAGDNDLREVHRRAAGDPQAALALEVYGYRIRKYVGAYLAVLGRVDAIVFTAGVGEHDAAVRARSLAGLEPLGIAVDPTRNEAAADGPRVISPEAAGVAVLVVPTDEELEMAKQAAALVSGPGPGTAARRPAAGRARGRR
jgi:acetate kinase